MSVRYNGYLELPGNEETNILPVSSFGVTERYNGGWRTIARISAASETPMSVGQMFGLAINQSMMPGTPAILHLALESDEEEEGEEGGGEDGGDEGENEGENKGVIVRAWPSLITSIDPAVSSDGRTGNCDVHLVDPISYLLAQPVWGAYRACSAGEVVGGVLSMAAGGDGRPTIEPVMAGMPSLYVVELFRDSLNELPYAIACGQSLGEWLEDALGTLGLRMEFFGSANGRVSLTLTDSPPNGEPVPMFVLGSKIAANGEDDPGDTPGDAPGEISAGALAIKSVDAYPSPIRRGGILDDPTLGSFRRFGQLGAIGNVQSGSGLDLDEAAMRASLGLAAAQAQMLIVRAETRQPGMRPGRIAEFNANFFGMKRWQVARVRHELRGNVYENAIDLFPAASSWHPPAPSSKPPRIVSAIVDGGRDDYMFHEPIPRDRLGRIPVAMSFLPTPTGAEALMLSLADSNEDLRITLADFESSQVDEYTNRKEHWDEEAEKLRAGEYDDPFPGRDDDELSDEEKTRREELAEKRATALKYVAYQWAKARDEADRDRDGYVSSRDEAVSEELKAELSDPAKRAEIEKQWEAYRTGKLEEAYPDESERAAVLARQPLLREYGALFGDGAGPEGDSGLGMTQEEQEEAASHRHDADMADERWPPRIPLTVVEPMAGSLHGFIPAHRHGDICRVAVHGPFHAEILGFQYRSNRQINANLVQSTAGLVVEHAESAWSGVVFRTTEELEAEGTAGNSEAEAEAEAE